MSEDKNVFGRCTVLDKDGKRREGTLVGVQGDRCAVRFDGVDPFHALAEVPARDVIPDAFALERMEKLKLDTTVFFKFVRTKPGSKSTMPDPGAYAEQIFKDALKASGATTIGDIDAEMTEIGRQRHEAENWCLQFFDYQHLPDALKAVSRPFSILAQFLVTSLPANQEKDAAMRKLLEAKDCAVRAVISHLSKGKR